MMTNSSDGLIPDRSRQTLTPSTLNALARDLLEGTFTHIWVKGEISNLSRPASGHLYFTLKDPHAQVRCALFRSYNQRVRIQPRDGMLVLAHGKLTVYGARGDYQLVLDQLDDEGEGALRRAYEQLYARLDKEGLFNPERKRPLPLYPRRIAVISSATGAVIKDICSVLQRRFPLVCVDLLPTNVQGEGAAGQITQMLIKADKSQRYSVILLARGGGSLEDLWPFNDETLARCIAQLTTPCVSAIGHETDFCLSDFVADRRAPTPSVGAELLVPDQTQLSHQLHRFQQLISRLNDQKITAAIQRADHLFLRLEAKSPKAVTALLAQRQIHAVKHLFQAAVHQLERHRHALDQLKLRLESQAPATMIGAGQQRLQRIGLKQAMERQLQYLQQQSTRLFHDLNAISPLRTLARGYTITTQAATGVLIQSIHQVAAGDRLSLRFGDGRCDVIVTARHPGAGD